MWTYLQERNYRRKYVSDQKGSRQQMTCNLLACFCFYRRQWGKNDESMLGCQSDYRDLYTKRWFDLRWEITLAKTFSFVLFFSRRNPFWHFIFEFCRHRVSLSMDIFVSTLERTTPTHHTIHSFVWRNTRAMIRRRFHESSSSCIDINRSFSA